MINSKSYSQTIVVDSTFNSTTEFFPFNQDDTIYGLGITGHITLNSDTSLIRVIFLNSDYEEYLLYEVYPYIADEWDFDIVNESDETKFLPTTEPYSLIIQICNASLNLTSLICTSILSENPDSLQELHKESVEQIKISSINSNIQEYEMLWFADETSVSQLSYSDKKSMFGEIYNLHGLDYYSGGIYSAVPGFDGPIEESSLVPDFDWRNRHGADDPIKDDFYYDPDGDGWLTDVKDQDDDDRPDCDGLCYIYAPLAVVEALVNLYFNQHLNYDLSEQHVLDCDSHISGECEGGEVVTTSNFISNHGVVDEECYPAEPPNGYCKPFPNTPSYQIKTQGTHNPALSTPDEKREGIILHGPLITQVEDYAPGSTQDHAMALIGYGTLKSGDSFHKHGTSSTIYYYVDDYPEYIGRKYWIYKNSWGSELWGDQGYMYHMESQFVPKGCKYYLLPIEDIITPSQTPDSIAYYDKDKDGYYWWGIYHEKPTACPGPDAPDSDDSEPRIGPYDDNYYGTPVKPIMEVSVFGQTIHNGGFYPINNLSQSIDIVFDVRNMGDAQLNFEEVSAFPDPYANVTLAGNDAGSFSYGEKLATKLGMEGFDGDQDDFTISYNGACTTTCTCVVTIHLDEFDMEDFTFAIAYADCNHVPSNERITGIEDWDDWRIILDNYRVEDGGVLTISGNVGFSDQVRFVVEPGGQLIIDGGTLINVCSDTWNGIEVWGDASLSQYPVSNQGYLNMLNGGSIEYADTAVQLTRLFYGVPSSNWNGGIVRCDDAIFRNNNSDVIFYSYNNFDPNTLSKVPNRSYFKQTEFINEEICEKDIYVGLQSVDGLYFSGCTFSNTVDKVAQNCTTINRGTGIYSFNSGFYIEDECLDSNTPCGSSKLCRFENLEYGIYALNAEFNEIISIDTAIFYNTYRGIYMNLIDYPEIIRNQFIYDENYQLETNYIESYGLDLEHCRSFVVEENVFINTASTPDMLGLQVLNSGPYAHEIYNNSFNGFTTGITAAGENRDEFGTGLCIKCNDFIDCSNDINVTDEGGLSGYYGIAFYQGEEAPIPPSGDPDPTYAAGNIFTEMSGNYTNYTNLLSCNSISYTYHGKDINPDIKIIPDPTSPKQPTQHIDLIPDNEVTYNSKDESCPSNLGTIIDIPSEMNMMTSESSMLNAYEDTLNLFVDGGDTEALNQDVQLSFPDEALEIRQELLNSSPYLSDTVMKSSIAKENVLPNVMIRDVLVANPQSAKSPSVLESLDDRFTPMPDYMMNEIMMGQYTYGNKELLEQKLSKHKRSRDLAFAKLMRHYHSDTLNTAASSDSIVSLLNDQNYLGTRYQLSMFYLSKHDSANAYSTLNNIPIDFDLTSNEQSTWQLYSDLFDINWEIMNDTIAIDSVHISNLHGIYNSQNTLPALYARNTLISVGELIYNEPVFLPSVLKVTPIWQKQPDIKPSSKLYVYPNPAHSFFIVEYSMDSFSDNAYLILTDMSGKHMKSIEISCQQNQIVIPCEDLPNGVYLIQLLKGNKTIESKKIIVSK